MGACIRLYIVKLPAGAQITLSATSASLWGDPSYVSFILLES